MTWRPERRSGAALLKSNDGILSAFDPLTELYLRGYRYLYKIAED